MTTQVIIFKDSVIKYHDQKENFEWIYVPQWHVLSTMITLFVSDFTWGRDKSVQRLLENRNMEFWAD